MKRLAIFVEGYTEALFVRRMIDEVATSSDVIVQTSKIRGGDKVPRRVEILEAARAATDESFYILIYDCGGEHLVAQRILEEHASLTKSGYAAIIGIRDVFPSWKRHEIPKLRRYLAYGISGNLAPVKYVLATMEVEAWFLSEHTHFSRIDPNLSPDIVLDGLGFDPKSDDMSLRDNPADDLRKAYGLVGLDQDKPWESTIRALDISLLYLEERHRVSCFNELAMHMDEFFA